MIVDRLILMYSVKGEGEGATAWNECAKQADWLVLHRAVGILMQLETSNYRNFQRGVVRQ
ncbi:hypothetical protein J2Z50_006578 [Ensifer mexicanus]|nr:hypothetical protein [Sinorhizobium mexicanum]